jgi:hypothetical protein
MKKQNLSRKKFSKRVSKNLRKLSKKSRKVGRKVGGRRIKQKKSQKRTKGRKMKKRTRKNRQRGGMEAHPTAGNSGFNNVMVPAAAEEGWNLSSTAADAKLLSEFPKGSRGTGKAEKAHRHRHRHSYSPRMLLTKPPSRTKERETAYQCAKRYSGYIDNFEEVVKIGNIVPDILNLTGAIDFDVNPIGADNVLCKIVSDVDQQEYAIKIDSNGFEKQGPDDKQYRIYHDTDTGKPLEGFTKRVYGAILAQIFSIKTELRNQPIQSCKNVSGPPIKKKTGNKTDITAIHLVNDSFGASGFKDARCAATAINRISYSENPQKAWLLEKYNGRTNKGGPLSMYLPEGYILNGKQLLPNWYKCYMLWEQKICLNIKELLKILIKREEFKQLDPAFIRAIDETGSGSGEYGLLAPMAVMNRVRCRFYIEIKDKLYARVENVKNGEGVNVEGLFLQAMHERVKGTKKGDLGGFDIRLLSVDVPTFDKNHEQSQLYSEQGVVYSADIFKLQEQWKAAKAAKEEGKNNSTLMFECEYDCGFENVDKEVVETHENEVHITGAAAVAEMDKEEYDDENDENAMKEEPSGGGGGAAAAAQVGTNWTCSKCGNSNPWEATECQATWGNCIGKKPRYVN